MDEKIVAFLARAELFMARVEASLPHGLSAPDWSPLGLWIGTMVLFTVSAAQAGLWAAVTLNIILAGVAMVFSWRGAKW